jgi:uncharacterized protein YjbJ (UPF0337 family)
MFERFPLPPEARPPWTRIGSRAPPIRRRVKEVIGKVTGDAKLESEGKADKIGGKVQNAIGGLKDTLKGK